MDIPDWCIAAGNPCKVIRKVTDEDKRKLFHNGEIDEETWQKQRITVVLLLPFFISEFRWTFAEPFAECFRIVTCTAESDRQSNLDNGKIRIA